MTIISLSIPDEMLRQLDRLVKDGGYGGRSDALRQGVKMLSEEHRRQKAVSGRVSGAMLLVHDEDDEDAFSHAKHGHESLIKTLIHNQLGGGKCLEVFILEGEASEVESLVRMCRKSGKAQYLKTLLA